MLISTTSMADLRQAATDILNFKGETSVLVFEGEMGSGKTTLIKALCEVANVQDVVTSPTFSIVNHYYSDTIGDIYHFDFYRIEDETEALDIGIEEYLYSGQWSFIEWPDRISSYIPNKTDSIQLKRDENGLRTLILSANNQKRR